ncbi:hypothetical protein D3C87_1266160 [compost metagenome]
MPIPTLPDESIVIRPVPAVERIIVSAVAAEIPVFVSPTKVIPGSAAVPAVLLKAPVIGTVPSAKKSPVPVAAGIHDIKPAVVELKTYPSAPGAAAGHVTE